MITGQSSGSYGGFFPSLPARYAGKWHSYNCLRGICRWQKTDRFVFVQNRLQVPFATASLQYAFYQATGYLMKLTIIRLQKLSEQDCIDLGKIWPEVICSELERKLDENHRLYAARFNDRLLAAVELTIRGTQGRLEKLEVREVTRRRGVGSYLLEEVIAQNPSLTQLWIADDGKADQQIIAAFMQACGFRTQADGWIYTRE